MTHSRMAVLDGGTVYRITFHNDGRLPAQEACLLDMPAAPLAEEEGTMAKVTAGALVDALALAQDLEASRRRTLVRLNAICPRCKTDVLDALDEAAYNWGGYGPPATTLLECPNCRAELEFRLEWDTRLWKADCFSSKSQEEIAANGQQTG